MCALTLILASITSYAAVIPNSQLPTGSDMISTPDGFRCAQAVAPDSHVEIGMYTEDSDNTGIYSTNETGGYIKLIIPINNNRERINCNRLYNLELRNRQEDRELDRIANEVFREK